jgi:hypothetical protein
LSANSVHVGAPLFVDLCGFLMWLWLPFAAVIYIDLLLFIDLCGFFTRL